VLVGAASDEEGWPIGRAVRTAREQRGWTREALAFHSGLSWSAISQIESGRRAELRPSSLNALATALDVTVDYLLGRSPAPLKTPLFKHRILPYATTEDVLAALVPWLLEGMAAGDPMLAVTRPENARALKRELGKAGGRIRLANASHWYRSMVAAMAAYQRFIDESLSEGASFVRIVGEAPWHLDTRSATEIESWTRYEALINLTLAAAQAEIVCLYDTATTPASVLAGAHETHPDTLEAGGVVSRSAHYDPCGVLLR